MKSYTIEFDGGEVSEGQFNNDAQAKAWAESVLEARGYDASALVTGDWDQDGTNDDDEQCWRMLYWASEAEADNDNGSNAICQLCKVGN